MPSWLFVVSLLEESSQLRTKKRVAYISPLLGKIPQKARSPMLSLMWRAEQRQGQFHLLGAAYSKIRDECNDCPSLEKFVEVAAGTLSIIPADLYFELSGWKIVDDGDSKHLVATIVDDNLIIATYPLQTVVSTQEIIQYCFDHGLINNMPTAATVTTQPHAAISFAALPQNHDLEAAVNASSVQSEPDAVDDAFEFFDFNDASSSNTYNLSFDAVTQDQQRAYENTPATAHWHPAIQPPILGIDPNIIQDEFDPFSFEIDQVLANM